MITRTGAVLRALPLAIGHLCAGAAATAAPAAPSSADGDWPMAARDYASTRFSPLIEITPANVRNLKVAFTFSTDVDRGQEAAPIVVGNTLDGQTIAVDTATGKEAWRTRLGDIDKGGAFTMAPLAPSRGDTLQAAQPEAQRKKETPVHEPTPAAEQ